MERILHIIKGWLTAPVVEVIGRRPKALVAFVMLDLSVSRSRCSRCLLRAYHTATVIIKKEKRGG